MKVPVSADTAASAETKVRPCTLSGRSGHSTGLELRGRRVQSHLNTHSLRDQDGETHGSCDDSQSRCGCSACGRELNRGFTHFRCIRSILSQQSKVLTLSPTVMAGLHPQAQHCEREFV